LILHARTHQDHLPVSTAARMLELLSELVEVFAIERRSAHYLKNNFAQQLTQKGEVTTQTLSTQPDARPIWQKGLRGEGQIVACADSGNDWDHCAFEGPHAAAPSTTIKSTARKVIAYVPFGDTGDDVNGHGTHVTGSITGDMLDQPDPSLASESG